VNIVTECIKKEMAQSEFPTLTGAVKRIREEGKHNDEASSIATFIENFNTGLGKMLFGNENSQPLTFTNQITVLGVQGLTLPNKVDGGARANTSLEDDERIGLAIMTAITKYVHIFSRNYEEDALMIMDEAWIFNSSQEGETLINEMLRTGRSLKTDIWLVTQAFDDYNTPTFRELIGCKMAYRPKSDANTDELIDFFGLQVNEDNRQVIANLETGICLYEDYRGRVEVIANDIMFEEWFEAFKTTDKDNAMLKAEEEHYA
ncbi:ATP-binding protein, partial [Staphylococcus saprophyticus]|uniref:ATP-binding protein n=3 Tax=Staphylococcus TaxID=1279 RepID=UPI0034C63384